MSGRKTPPVSILCFSDSSAWHREGPINFPNNLPQDKDIATTNSKNNTFFEIKNDGEGISKEQLSKIKELNELEIDSLKK